MNSFHVLCQHCALFKRLIDCSCYSDELIVAKEHFAEIGDDLDFTFVDLIEGVDPIYTYRRPKPPTPPPKEPTPPPVAAPGAPAAEGAAPAAAAVEGGAPAEPGAEGAAPVIAAPPKEPSPFELKKHFPPEGAEVPFVKTYEDPNAPAPSPAPEEKAPTPAPAEATPAPEEAPAPVAEEAAPAEAPAAEEPAPAAEEAPAAE